MEIDHGCVLDALPVMVWTALPDGDIDFVNPRWSEYAGLDAGDAHGRQWKAIVHPDDLAELLERWRSILASGDPDHMEARLRRLDGQYRWHLLHCKPMCDDVGRIVKWYGVATDVDDSRRAGETSRQRDLDFQSIVESVPIPVAVTTPSGAVEGLNQLTLDYFGKTFDELQGWTASDVVHPDDLEYTIAAQLAAHQAGTSYDVESRHRRADGVYRWFNVHGLPLRDRQGNILRWLHLLIDIDDRKRAEQALRESERKARLIVDSVPASGALLTADGEVEFANHQMCEFLGKTFEELQHWSTTDTVHPDDLRGSLERFGRAMATGAPYEHEQRHRRFDGVHRWFQVRGCPIRDGAGQVLGWNLLHIDIDDRKRVEEALRESERQLRLIVDTIPGLVAVFGPQGEIESLNKQFLGYLGQTHEEFANWPTNGTVHPDDLVRHMDTLKRSLDSGVPIDFETRLRRFDGIYRWIQIRGDAARDGAGNIVRWYCLMVDVDERKRAEEALAASEHNLRVTIDTIPALAWSACTDGTAAFLSQPYLDYAGLTDEQAQGWGWTSVVHPDDVNGLAATWQAILASGKPGEAEARIRRHDGEYRWFLFRVSPLRDEHGKIVKWYGVNTDIEDRKRSEESFRAIVETTPECVKVVARDGTVLRTNAAGVVMAGLQSVDDAIGQRFFDFVAPEHRTRYCEFHANICAGQKGFLEFDLINVQGVRRHMETHAAPMRDSTGSVVQLGVTRDITARKQMEENLRRSEAFLAEGQHLARMGNLSWRVATGEIIWSEPLYRIFELEPDTAMTLDRIASRVHPDDLPLLADMVQRAQRGDSDFEYQHRILLPDQSIKHLHLIAHRTRDHADGIEYIGAVLDITQRRLSEEALEKLRSELAQVTRIMSLGALTASIAHEVNQPLAGIITNAGTCLRMLAADPPNIDGALETARRTIRDGNRAADVIARLRALFSRKTVTIEPVNLNEAVREVIALSWSDLQRRRVVLHSELADGLPLACGDRVQLQQVIMNLLRNAADAMGSVEDRPRRLLIRTMPEQGNQVRLSVRDTGVGFGSQGAEKLFEAFYTTKSDGMGIGLSVSRSIVESHSGRLWVETNDDWGVTFSFVIPEYSRDELPVQAPDTTREPVTGSAQNAVWNS